MLEFSNFRLGSHLGLGLLVACLGCSARPEAGPREIPRSNLIRIVSPQDGLVVEPGSTIRVVVEVAPGSGFRDVTVLTAGFSHDLEPLSEPPYEFLLTASTEKLGPQKITGLGAIAPGNVAFSEPITVDIETEEPASELGLSPRRADFGYPGEEGILSVHEVMPGGRWRKLNNSTRIVFKSNDEAVAIVTPNGKVTATGPGRTTIKLRYQELERVIPVSVPHTIDGDLTGNGMVCTEDLNKILGLTDVDPKWPASGPFDARDRDKDGVITVADAELLRKLCTNPDCSCTRPKKE